MILIILDIGLIEFLSEKPSLTLTLCFDVIQLPPSYFQLQLIEIIVVGIPII